MVPTRPDTPQARRPAEGSDTVLELDEALIRFQQCASAYGAGHPNHGPTAAEALCRLGHAALMTGLVDIYAPRLPPREPGTPIPEGERAGALGARGRVGDWRASYERDLAASDWREVLGAALPQLVDGLFAFATHGLLRTAHAVRALEEDENPTRLAELAWGLGTWSAAWQSLPGEPGLRVERGCGPAETLARITPVAPAGGGELLGDAVAVLDTDAAFAEAVAAFDADAMPFDSAVGALCRCAAGLYLDHPHARIAYAEAVTASAALRIVAPFMTDPLRRRALGRGVQAVAAIHAVSALPTGREAATGPSWVAPVEEGEVERLADSSPEIRYRAACSLEVHAIELAEACLREDALTPDPLLRRAAADAALQINEGNRGRVT